MRKQNRIRFTAAALAAALALTLLPAFALADDGNISLYDGKENVNTAESDYLSTPAGHPGDTISIYIPIKNVGSGTATDVSCEIAVSGNPDSFPFVNENESTTAFTANAYKRADTTDGLVSWKGDTLSSGEHAYFKLDVTLLSSATSGYKTLVFTVNYSYDGADCTDTVDVTLYVRPVESTSSSSSGTTYKSKPKVIVESYEFVQDAIYAGDTVQLRIAVANTSKREAVTDLQLDFTDESGAVMPAPGGSNSIFIGDIAKGDIYAFTIDLVIAPDAEAKTHLLAITLSYEGTKNRQEFEETASVSVPIQQKTRVRINDPVVYDDAWVNSSLSVGLTVFNMGKSPLYNCIVDIEGDDMTLEEAYFGGNVASGGTMRADLSLTPLLGGEVTVNIRVTYEDVYGNQTEQLVPLTMYVNDDSSVEMIATDSDALTSADASVSGGGIAWYWWALLAAALITGAIILGIKARKKRERSLEDL